MNSLGNIRAIQHLEKYKPLMYELVVRDLKVKYRRSVLGYVWSLLNPLLMMAVMNIVFSYLFRYDIPNYPLYLICGQTLWNFFHESTNMAMYSVLVNGSLIKKVYIPKFIFPVSRVLSSFVTMSFSLIAILIVMLFTRTPVHPQILLFMVPLAFLLMFSMGVGMLLAALAVYFRDVTHLYSVVTLAWMYLTPIFYPTSVIPENVINLIKLNPMYHYIYVFRELILYGNIPELNAWLSCAGCSTAAVLLGLFAFGKLQKNFILYL